MASEKTADSRKRPVPHDQRKRGLFSCDRCKQKKIKCNRINHDSQELKYDTHTACTQCLKSKSECITTLPRKKRGFNTKDNIEFHYKCLYLIMQKLYPDKDLTNIYSLIELGESLELKMPSVAKIMDQETNINLNDIDHRIEKIYKSDEDETETDLVPTTKSQDADELDNLISDISGNGHFIGSAGTPSILKGLGDIILTKQFKKKLSFEVGTAYTFISSSNEHSTNIDDLRFQKLDDKLFPKSEFDYYIDNFFEKLHPIYPILDPESFRFKYATFWDDSRVSIEYDDYLIYMVLLLGKNFDSYINATINEELVTNIIEIIKLNLNLYIYSPSLDGIVLIFLASIYLFSYKNRELSWVLLSICSIQLISLGYHKESLVSSFTPSEQEKIRRLFWTIFKFSQINGSNFGRGSIFKNDEIDLDFPLFTSFNKAGSSPEIAFEDESKRCNIELFKLSKISNTILSFRSQNKRLAILSQENIHRNLQFNNTLNSFYDNLPANFKLINETSTHTVLRFNLQYNYFQMILTLPFLLNIVQNNIKLNRTDKLILILIDGIKASVKTSEIVYHLKQINHLNGKIYLDIFYIYVSILVLILTYFLLLNPSSTLVQRNNLIKMFNEYDLTSLNILNSINKFKFCKSNIIIEGTMIRMHKTIDYLLVELGINDELNFMLGTENFDILNSSFNSANVNERAPSEIDKSLKNLKDSGHVNENLNFYLSSLNTNERNESFVIDDELVDFLFGDI